MLIGQRPPSASLSPFLVLLPHAHEPEQPPVLNRFHCMTYWYNYSEELLIRSNAHLLCMTKAIMYLPITTLQAPCYTAQRLDIMRLALRLSFIRYESRVTENRMIAGED